MESLVHHEIYLLGEILFVLIIYIYHIRKNDNKVKTKKQTKKQT